ncbi:HAD family hydrolase [Chloroflexota bacterium]
MIRAVFFDWFNTLAHYDPPRYQLHHQACQESGIEVLPEVVRRGVLAGDRYFFDENIKSPVEARNTEEKTGVYVRYQEILFAEAGVSVDRETLLKVMGRVHQLFKGVKWALFDDVLPTVKTLKERQLVLGLITNASRELVAVYAELGLEPYLDFVVTSEEVGSDKPQPPIFRAALERAAVAAAEAVHVGDQYKIDISGAQGVGINPILLDRYDQHPDITECPRIRDLPEIFSYL